MLLLLVIFGFVAKGRRESDLEQNDELGIYAGVGLGALQLIEKY